MLSYTFRKNHLQVSVVRSLMETMFGLSSPVEMSLFGRTMEVLGF